MSRSMYRWFRSYKELAMCKSIPTRTDMALNERNIISEEQERKKEFDICDVAIDFIFTLASFVFVSRAFSAAVVKRFRQSTDSFSASSANISENPARETLLSTICASRFNIFFRWKKSVAVFIEVAQTGRSGAAEFS